MPTRTDPGGARRRSTVRGVRRRDAALARRGATPVRRGAALVVAGLLLITACEPGADAGDAQEAGESPAARAPSDADSGGAGGAGAQATLRAPSAPEGPLSDEVAAAVQALTDERNIADVAPAVLADLGAGGDARVAWLIADVLRLVDPRSEAGRAAIAAFEQLTGARVPEERRAGGAWVWITNQLIGWDLPVWGGYQQAKAELLLQVEPGWRPFFADDAAEVDWRLVTWGGVGVDIRPYGSEGQCPTSCIPALDEPELTPAEEGDWYDDSRVVFGVTFGDAAVALPRNQMKVHELVHLRLDGERIAVPYCTLCGAAIGYRLERVPAEVTTPVLRTSGLLLRSNKMLFDLHTDSLIDMFTGAAVSGPLREQAVTLTQIPVVASTWGAWRAQHPDTRIVARDGGIGRTYPLDPLRGRDDDGPIFPVGPVDPRLPAQKPVVGVVTADGQAVAFPVEQARSALRAGESLAFEGLRVVLDGDGLRVLDGDRELPAHQAFWFAWSQFHPDTVVWRPDR